MMRNPVPSSSEIVMTAMFHLQQDGGISFNDIVKYSKTRYGLNEVNVKNGISSALRRGLNYKILYKKNGLYCLNRSIIKVTSKKDGNAPEEDDESKKDETETNQEIGNGKESSSSLKKTQTRKKRKSKELFLCPDCQVKVNGDPTKVDGEKRYELRPRKTPSESSDKGGPTSDEDPKEGERCRRRRTQWGLKMGISLRGRRPKM